MRIVFFGDSICVGQGVSIHRGWVTRISALLETLSQEFNEELVIVNASVNGNTTRQALERMPYEVQSSGVRFLLVQFGMNDCNYWDTDQGNARVSGLAFQANLKEIIARGRTFGAQRVLINTNHPTTRTTTLMAGGETTYQQSNERYNDLVREVAASEGDNVILNDIEKTFAGHLTETKADLADYLLDDELHLSVKGHDLYYQATAPIIERQVRELMMAPQQS